MQNAHPACYHALAQKINCSTTHPFAESHQKFRGELSSALGQKAQQRHHLLLGAHQAVGDDVGTPVLRGRHIQQQRVPEGFTAQLRKDNRTKSGEQHTDRNRERKGSEK